MTPEEISEKAREFIDYYDACTCVPIIGEEVFCYINDDGSREPLHSYLIRRFSEVCPGVRLCGDDSSTGTDYFAFSCFARELGDFIPKYKRFVKEAREAGRIELDSAVAGFLRAFAFPLIVTTSCFNFLDTIINENSAAKYNSLYYSINGDNREPNLDKLLRSSRIIYHIFGNAEAKGTSWVANEESMLEFLHAIHTSDHTCTNLSDYANRNTAGLLLLGVSAPDWLFRFFWYPLGRNAHESRNGYWLLDGSCNVELAHFLERIRYRPVREVHEFLRQATALKIARDESEKKGAELEAYDYFLSYAGVDEDLAESVYTLLRAQNYTVWFDRRGDSEIKGGDKYTEKFHRGIEKSTRAITLITENYIKGVSNPERGLCKETGFIKDKALRINTDDFKFCVPILVKDRLFNNRPLTTDRIESWAADVSSIDGGIDVLFTGTHMIEFDPENPVIKL